MVDKDKSGIARSKSAGQRKAVRRTVWDTLPAAVDLPAGEPLHIIMQRERRPTVIATVRGRVSATRKMIKRALENIELTRRRMANDQIEIDRLRAETQEMIAELLT